MFRWLISLVVGGTTGYILARNQAREELEEFRRELAACRAGNGRAAEAPPEQASAPEPEPVAAPEPPPAMEEEVDERTAMLIAAAVAAYLGKRAVVRRVRMVGHRTGDPWAVTGRVNIHASHNVINAHMTRA